VVFTIIDGHKVKQLKTTVYYYWDYKSLVKNEAPADYKTTQGIQTICFSHRLAWVDYA